MGYLRTAWLLGRNLTLRSARNPVTTGLFVLLPVALLALFGGVTRSAGDHAAFNGLFAIFTGIALMMLGVVGLATMLPMDKKLGVLRRLEATPFRASQLMLGCTISSLALGVVSIAIMVGVSLVFFHFNVQGSYLDLMVFILLGLLMSVSIGLAIGGWAKDDTAATFVSQIVFLGSLAVSGVWFPRVALPGWLHAVSNFAPLTPIIDGVKDIATQGKGLFDLGPQLGVMAIWVVVAYLVGSKLFRWESN